MFGRKAIKTGHSNTQWRKLAVRLYSVPLAKKKRKNVPLFAARSNVTTIQTNTLCTIKIFYPSTVELCWKLKIFKHSERTLQRFLRFWKWAELSFVTAWLFIQDVAHSVFKEPYVYINMNKLFTSISCKKWNVVVYAIQINLRKAVLMDDNIFFGPLTYS